MKKIAENRKARHDYFILEVQEAGIELFGTEVKSLRAGKVNLKDSYAMVSNGELFLHNMHISPYEQGNIFNCDPLRVRRLLMHKKEIAKLFGQVMQKGLSLVPISLYFKGPHVKVGLALAQGKKLHDKRSSAAEKSAKRDIERAMRAKE